MARINPDDTFISNVERARNLAEDIIALCDDHFEAAPGEITDDQLGHISDVVFHLREAIAAGRKIA